MSNYLVYKLFNSKTSLYQKSFEVKKIGIQTIWEFINIFRLKGSEEGKSKDNAKITYYYLTMMVI